MWWPYHEVNPRKFAFRIVCARTGVGTRVHRKEHVARKYCQQEANTHKEVYLLVHRTGKVVGRYEPETK